MGYEVGDLVLGTVNQVRPYALFMSFDDGSKGLLHISEISDEYVRDIEMYGIVGDVIKVKVIEVDPFNGFLRVSYKQVPEEERYSTHVNEARIYLEESEKDFSELEKKLPIWIEETLKKVKEK